MHAPKAINIEVALIDAFPKHAAAIEEYCFHVRPQEQAAYDEAWRKYYKVGGSVRFFDYYMGDNPHELFEQRVQAILRFTET